MSDKKEHLKEILNLLENSEADLMHIIDVIEQNGILRGRLKYQYLEKVHQSITPLKFLINVYRKYGIY